MPDNQESKAKLGDTYYEVPLNGMIKKRAVLSIPFSLSPVSKSSKRTLFASAQDALAVADQILLDAIQEEDSLKALKLERANRADMFQYLKFLENLDVTVSTLGKQILLLSEVQDELSKVRANPGAQMWLAITPETPYILTTRQWRPALFFILRATVKSVRLIDGKLEYFFLGSTMYCPKTEEVFHSANAAQQHLTRLMLDVLPIEGVDVKRILIYTEEDEAVKAE